MVEKGGEVGKRRYKVDLSPRIAFSGGANSRILKEKSAPNLAKNGTSTRTITTLH